MIAIPKLSLNSGQKYWRPSYLAAGIALVVTLVAGIFAEIQNNAMHHQRARAEVGEQLGIIRAKLEGNINSNIQLVRGLVAVIATEPDIDQQHFAKIAGNLMGTHSQLRSIAAAPDLVISLMYPLKGNEKAVGLDYRTNDAQRDAALRAVDSREMVLAGPVDLLQGGKGFIGRFPVFYEIQSGRGRLWGLVSAVVDVDRLYADSGLNSPDLPLNVVIRGVDATGGDGEAFFGNAEALDHDPVLAEVSLPSGSWQLAATPRGGWSDTPANAWQIRYLILLGGLLVILPISIAGYLYDQRREHVRELNRRGAEMQRLQQRLKLALNTSRIGIWELNVDTWELSWDERMRELYDIADDVEVLNLDHWKAALLPEDVTQAEADFKQAVATGATYKSEFRVLTRKGEIRWIRAIGAVHEDEGRQRYILGVNWDVSTDVQLKTHLLAAMQNAEVRNNELEDARAQMERNSLHDSLTGLPNRRYLDEQLLGKDDGANVTALLHIDLDRFKQINDTLGHAAGDAMLIHAASILKAHTRQGDFIARIGGDEFVIATTTDAGTAQLEALASRIIEHMRQPVPYEGHECRFGVSIGIAIANSMEPDSTKRLLIDADIALYRAKSNGRNRYEFFNDALKAEVVRNKRIADDILNGLERKEFLPYFQPQFDAVTLDVIGVEALARWQHPREGTLAPDAFLKTADELNVVPLIDRSILEQTLWQSTRWKAAGISIPKMSVNVSAGRLYEPDLLDSLDGMVIEEGTLSFELLESIFLDENNDTIVANIEKLKRRGIEIEIDDFGTGYASIVSLIHVRPTRLKIDRSLILPIVESESRRRLVASIIDIGRSLGIKIIAEGVETMEHAAILRDLGCDTLQGYALARPMSSEQLMEFVREESWRRVA
ncbi:EAL domain-containing protein [Hoeflea sp. G2-23]|uniref:EAL domain-containing protein n=1 Tax=Hoeflea algicola TaxID=2983763 RepID=A0ABT3ZAJ0_9HYPH|nr:EAL domain-containing protein [Hoeflea algicola]MCY0148354.1 EAL domain-containing protein [Hoeflea algicola]